MKNNYFFITFALLFSFTTGFSQTQTATEKPHDKAYLAITVGANSPMGAFGSHDASSNASGMANSGISFDVSLNNKMSKHIGFAIVLRQQNNSFDKEAVLKEQLSQPSLSGWQGTIKATPWVCNMLMTGVYGSFEASEKISLETRVLIGFANSHSTALTFDMYRSGYTSFWVKQSSVKSSGFGYFVSAALKYNLGKRICFLVGADYAASKAEYKDIVISDSFGGESKTNISQDIAAVSFNFGLGFRFYK